jgi:hypothetical protein
MSPRAIQETCSTKQVRDFLFLFDVVEIKSFMTDINRVSGGGGLWFLV